MLCNILDFYPLDAGSILLHWDNQKNLSRLCMLTVLWGQRLRTIGLKHRLHLNYEQKALRFINLSGLLLSHIHSPFQFLSVCHVIQAASSPMGGNTYPPYVDESTDTQRCEATLWQGKERRLAVILALLTVDMQLKTCSDPGHRLK